MPVIIRNSYVFEGRGKGWRETWFTNPTNPSLDAALTLWLTTTTKRAALLGTDYNLKAAECSVELDATNQPVLGDSAVKYLGITTPTNEGGADVDLSLLMRISTADRTRHRNVFMGGIWDDIEADGGRYEPNNPVDPWVTLLNTFKTAMIGIGAGWIGTTKGPKVGINSAIQNANDHVDIVFAAPGPFGAGPYPPRTKVRINTAKVKSRLSGETIVSVTSATTCTTIDKMAIFAGPTVGWYGFVHTLGFVQGVTYDDLKIARRKRGRPLLVTPGRAAAAALG
jgi:hypothetical protein